MNFAMFLLAAIQPISASTTLSKNIYGCLFHPENSGKAGIEILKQFYINFVKKLNLDDEKLKKN